MKVLFSCSVGIFPQEATVKLKFSLSNVEVEWLYHVENICNTNHVDTKSISWALYKIYHEDKQTMSAKIQ